MILSRHKNGQYYVYYTDPLTGKRKSKTTGTHLKREALKFLTRFQQEIEDLPDRKKQITFRQAFWDHLKWVEVNHTYNTFKTYKTTYNAAVNYFGNKQLGELDQLAMEDYLTYRAKSVSVYQARRDFIHLNCMLNRCLKRELLEKNPLENVRRFKLPEKEPKFFSEKEFEELLANISDPELKDIVVFAVNTGLRQMEIVRLTWSQVNFKEGYVVLNNREHITKSKKLRYIPLNSASEEALRSRYMRKTGDLVFTFEGRKISQDSISKRFKRVVKKSNVNQKLNFHSLRHTFATWLVQKEVPIYQVSKLLGHSDIRTTQIYANLILDDLHKAVDKL